MAASALYGIGTNNKFPINEPERLGVKIPKDVPEKVALNDVKNDTGYVRCIINRHFSDSKPQLKNIITKAPTK